MGKKILITGASTGMGAATASLLAPGNEIYVHYNSSKEAAEEVCKKVVENGGIAHAIRADLGTEQGCLSLISQMEALTDHLDVLVNNAGGLLKRMSPEEITWDFMHQVFALNTFSVLTLSTKLASLLKKGTDPCIINITSQAIRLANADAATYVSAKGAADSMTRALAAAYAGQIRVNSVVPGVVDSPFHDKVTNPERFKTFASSIPVGRVGAPIDIAIAVRFLIEDSFMHGASIDVNGGQAVR